MFSLMNYLFLFSNATFDKSHSNLALSIHIFLHSIHVSKSIFASLRVPYLSPNPLLSTSVPLASIAKTNPSLSMGTILVPFTY